MSTAQRPPAWGDAADLIAIMDVQHDGDTRYVSPPGPDSERPVVEASQILGQSIVAASRHTPGRRAVAASMVFPRPASAREPYVIAVEPVTDGRTMSAFATRATQGDRTCGFGTALLDVTAPDVIRHRAAPPEIAGPDQSTPHDMGVTGRELRIVDDAYTGDPEAPVGPPELGVWVRFDEVPDDQPIHAGLLAQFTGHISIAAALRPHAGVGQDQAHRTLSTAINAISLSIHADVRADRWMLYHHRSTVAGDGMTHSECRVYDEDRALVASFTVEAMVRAFADPTNEADYRSAL
ncbi:MAG: thioesterase family protein [Acidimicrobiales bacterium]|nr:thioesterase family protein [Acidimicrobiales bacterium]